MTMGKILSIAAFLSLIPCLSSLAQDQESEFGTWFSAGVEKKLAKGLSVEVDGEYRLSDFKRTDRWAVGASLSYRLYRNEQKTFDVKANAGVKYVKAYYPESVTYKGDTISVWREDGEHRLRAFNMDTAYTVGKIRAFASVSASYKIGRFKFSLRERYQFTGNDSVCVNEYKWRYDKRRGDIVLKDVEEEWKAVNNRRHSLRSRVQVSYDIRHFPVGPYASVEVYNDLKENFSFEKVRYLFGLDFELSKQHDLKLYYMYQNHADDDEPGGHVVGLSYAFEF